MFFEGWAILSKFFRCFPVRCNTQGLVHTLRSGGFKQVVQGRRMCSLRPGILNIDTSNECGEITFSQPNIR